jgi:hypothetical protein
MGWAGKNTGTVIKRTQITVFFILPFPFRIIFPHSTAATQTNVCFPTNGKGDAIVHIGQYSGCNRTPGV